MQPEEIAKHLVNLLGTGMRIDFIRLIVNEIGYTKLARLANSTGSAIKTALERGSVGDDLSYRIFLGLAKEKPHLLRYAFEVVINRYDKIINEVYEAIKKLEEEKIRQL